MKTKSNLDRQYSANRNQKQPKTQGRSICTNRLIDCIRISSAAAYTRDIAQGVRTTCKFPTAAGVTTAAATFRQHTA